MGPALARRAGAASLLFACALVIAGCVASSQTPGALSLGATSATPGSGAASSQETPVHLTAYSSATAPAGFRGLCGRYPWACRGATRNNRFSDAELRALADRINRKVNRTIREATDYEVYGVEDYWSLPYSGAGDCEDFALLKMKRLIEAGVPENRLFLAQAILPNREMHMVLVLRTDGGDYILDNLNNTLTPWWRTRLTFLKIQNASNRSRWDAVLLGPYATRQTAEERARNLTRS